MAIACAAAAALFSVRSLRRTDERLQKTERAANRKEGPAPPLRKLPRTEQEIAALKREELELAEKLRRDSFDNENSLMVMGNALNRHGNAVEALGFYERVLKMNPRRADVYAVMGRFLLNEGKLEEAIGHWRKALDIQPQSPGVHSNIGHALMMLGRHDEAIEALEQETRIAPDSSLAHFLLGQTHLMREEYEKAKENYEAAVKIDPAYANAYYGLATISTRLGNSDKAKEYSEKFKKLKAEAREDLKDRKVLYDDIDQTRKNTALTYIEAAQVYRDAGKLDKAQELLRRAIGLDPGNIACLLQMASLHQNNGRLSEALQVHKKIAEIEPENAICHFKIGILSARLNRLDEAEQAFRKVIALAPQQSSGYRELALLHLKKGEKLRQAVQLAQKAVALEATAVNYFVLSWACFRNGDHAKALAAIKQAIELEPGNPQYLQLYELIEGRN